MAYEHNEVEYFKCYGRNKWEFSKKYYLHELRILFKKGELNEKDN